MCHVTHIVFGSPLGISGISVPSFIIVWYMQHILGREGLFGPPPHPWAAPKKPILNRVKEHLLNNTAPLGDYFWYILSLFEKTAWKFKRRLKRNNRIDNIDNNINVISSIIFRWLCQTLTPEYFQQLNTCLFSNLNLISNNIKVCSHYNARF